MKYSNVRKTELISGASIMITLAVALLFSVMGMAQADEASEAAGQKTDTAELQWILTDTKVNPDNEPTEFIGGGEMPFYYPEPRYLGKYEKYTVTDGSLTYRHKSVDHGYLYFDATFVAKFDKPPARMIAGDTITLNATTEGSGYVSEYAGGWNAGIKFQYFAEGMWFSGDSDWYAATSLDFIPDTATVHFVVPDVTADGRIVINANQRGCAACLVQYVYEPGPALQEGFVLQNTGSGEVEVNGVSVPQCDEFRQEFEVAAPVASGGSCRVTLDAFDQLMIKKRGGINISAECFEGLAAVIYLTYFDGIDTQAHRAATLLLTIKALHHDPSICDDPVKSQSSAKTSNNHISLALQSGGARFQPVIDNLWLDIETNTAKVRSDAQNDFAVDYNPDTDLTIAACYKGRATVAPTNPALSSVTLEAGQMVAVEKDRIGPVERIPRASILPSLLLLTDDEE